MCVARAQVSPSPRRLPLAPADFDRLDLDPEPGSCYLMRIKPEEGRSPEEIFSSFSLGCEGMPWVSGAVISNTNSSSGPGPGGRGQAGGGRHYNVVLRVGHWYCGDNAGATEKGAGMGWGAM